MRINPEMVILARDYRAMTQEELAARTGFSQPKIARIESGRSAELDIDEAQKLVAALRFPLDFLTQDEVRVGFGSSSYYYRKRSALSAADRKRIQSTVNILRLHLKRLLSAVDVHASRPIRRFFLDEYSGSPGHVARALRAYWKLPDGPIRNLTAVVESAGVFVIPCDLGSREMDGTGLWLGELPPIIFIRSDLPGDRWRFTVAHELGHLMMHEAPTEEMEEEANQFAAELLMPEIEIRPQFAGMRRIGLPELANLKSYWMVAMSALLRRAKDLGYLDGNQSRYLYQRMSALGIRMQEPVPIAREEPTTIRQLLSCFTEQMGYDGDSLADFLRIEREDLESIYGLKVRSNKVEQPRLRIVK